MKAADKLRHWLPPIQFREHFTEPDRDAANAADLLDDCENEIAAVIEVNGIAWAKGESLLARLRLDA